MLLNLYIFSAFTSRSYLTQVVMGSEEIYWAEIGVAKPFRIYIQLGYERNFPKLRTTSDDRSDTTSWYPNNTSLGRFPKRTRGLSGGGGGVWNLTGTRYACDIVVFEVQGGSMTCSGWQEFISLNHSNR